MPEVNKYVDHKRGGERRVCGDGQESLFLHSGFIALAVIQP